MYKLSGSWKFANLFAQCGFVLKRKPVVIYCQEVAHRGVALHHSDIGVDYLSAYLIVVNDKCYIFIN